MRVYGQEREANKTLWCPHCKASVRRGWNYCKLCGRSLNPAHASRRGGSGTGAGAGGESPAVGKWVLLVIAGGVLGFVTVAGARRFLGAANTAAPGAAPTPGAVAETVAAPQPTETAAPTPAETGEMVYIPGGKFTMGRNSEEASENPAHEVSVKPFFLDTYEVTCEQYKNFVTATGRATPKGWAAGHCPESGGSLPVTGVSWEDAEAFAAWAGKRLPTEAEWEFAARGPRGLLYPWGNEWKDGAANVGPDGKGKVVAVGSHPAGASPFGVHDMLGNAWEWTASGFAPYRGGGGPPGERAPAGRRLKVLRGGCFMNSDAITAAFRRGWPAAGADYAQTGFRCAKDADR